MIMVTHMHTGEQKVSVVHGKLSNERFEGIIHTIELVIVIIVVVVVVVVIIYYLSQ